MKAKSFADREIRYTLKAQGQGAGTFNIGPTSGIVKLAKELDFEDLRQPHVYSLVVTATEDSGGFSTSVEVYLLQILDNCYTVSSVSFDISVYAQCEFSRLRQLTSDFQKTIVTAPDKEIKSHQSKLI